MTKTNVIRLLEKAGIPFRTAEYEVDESDLSGVHVARQLGQPCEQVFKTLVLRGAKLGPFVCCIPVAEEVDLKKAADAAGEKKVEMLPMKELLPTTGYIRGGCSPVGMKKKYPVWLDETAELYDEIAVSAGVRGMQVILAPQDLMGFVGARVADLTIV
ncbi:Cys-tRNA(Pro) deacylase [Diplocloster modestus]|uniref:Cys-tRNA(Pro)/Cys-tRNA(Cys) deacylase n=1 Tax=Diplocloster modestus TaxID=2850322 RepID=A0ABS6K3L8_9FIRM|nr:Cys-tRNA(Pro) deacylase [Diplocloster modestus]MBU9725119.1 Cys-tRNA(Pro) deacylase [Diplocloster modestus]